MKAKCEIEGCERPSRSRKMCESHYKKDRYRTSPNYRGPRRINDINESFALRTKPEGDCIVWTGGRFPSGHGSVSQDHQSRFAHRVAYEMKIGPVPEGMVLDHICRNPPCVNVDHLRVVTVKQNGENRDGPNRNNRHSRHLGVSYSARMDKWSAKVTHQGKSYWGGRHDTEEAAASAAVELRTKLFTHNDADRTAA